MSYIDKAYGLIGCYKVHWVIKPTYPFTPQHMEEEYKHPLHKKHNILSWHSSPVHEGIYVSNQYMAACTCSELKMVKSHANTSVFRFTANSPRTQVIPSRGRRMSDAFTRVLGEEGVWTLYMYAYGIQAMLTLQKQDLTCTRKLYLTQTFHLHNNVYTFSLLFHLWHTLPTDWSTHTDKDQYQEHTVDLNKQTISNKVNHD